MSTYNNQYEPTQPRHENLIDFSEAAQALGGRDQAYMVCPLCSHQHVGKDRKLSLQRSTDYPGCIVCMCYRSSCAGSQAFILRPDGYVDPRDEQQREREAEEARQKRAAKKEDDHKLINGWWDRAMRYHGSVAEAYFEGRGLEIPEEHWSEVRYEPSHHFRTSSLDFYAPAVFVPMRNIFIPREIIGLHRIALYVNGTVSNRRDEDGGKVKLGKGSFGGRSAAMLGWPRNGVLGVCEGFETAVGILQLGLVECVWAFTGDKHMASFPVLKQIDELHIFGDHDREKQDRRAGSIAAMKLADKYRQAGRVVYHSMAAEEGMDFADIASGKCGVRTVGCDFYMKGSSRG